MNFNLQINTYKKQNGTQAIRLRLFTSKNDIQYISTDISVLPNQLGKKIKSKKILFTIKQHSQDVVFYA